jgi:hypothetical protein
METQERTLTPSIISNASQSHNGLVIANTGTYIPAELVPAWPPSIPKDAEFLPMERFSSQLQFTEVKRTFEVTIDQRAYNRMMYYVMSAPGEVSGFGKVARKGNSFHISDVIVLEQKNTGASSDISQGTLEKFMKLMKKRGLDTEGYDLWWHSHVYMMTRFSQTDLDTIEELRSNRFTLSLVTNKLLEPRCRVDFYNPVRYGIDGIALKVIPTFDPAMAAELQAEMDGLMKKPRRAPRDR